MIQSTHQLGHEALRCNIRRSAAGFRAGMRLSSFVSEAFIAGLVSKAQCFDQFVRSDCDVRRHMTYNDSPAKDNSETNIFQILDSGLTSA